MTRFAPACTAIAVAFAAIAVTTPRHADACTNFLVTKKASTDNSTMITYSADSHQLYGELYFTPAGRHQVGEMIGVYEWDTGKFLGKIPQAPVTFSVVGNMNEHQVSIGETTFTGRAELQNPEGLIDYGSLMFLALQRAKTAREAIGVMTSLVAEHGYYSTGESFSVADPDEAWILEMIGKGKDIKGAVWVARKIPDGYVSAHANQARIRTFPRRGDDVMFSPDVVTFAREKGYFTGTDADFSFAAVYAPADFGAQRFCEARVWSFFRRVAPSMQFDLDYVRGVHGATPLPLWIKPEHKLSPRDLQNLSRDHFEDSEFYLGDGVGAGPYHLPYRWRPLEWEVDGVKYFNERSTATQQTGFSFVAQMRPDLPNPIGGIFWFSVDDTASTVYVPMYCGINGAPLPYRVRNGDFKTFTWDSAFWAFNAVANLAYGRYSEIIPLIQNEQALFEGQFEADIPTIDATAMQLYRQSPALARDYLTTYSAKQAGRVLARWQSLWQELFVKFLDGNVRDEMGQVTHPGYSKDWYKRIVDEKPEHFKVREFPGAPASH